MGDVRDVVRSSSWTGSNITGQEVTIDRGAVSEDNTGNDVTGDPRLGSCLLVDTLPPAVMSVPVPIFPLPHGQGQAWVPRRGVGVRGYSLCDPHVTPV